jgi:CDP-glucose 4,6-dehydratase
MAINPEFWQHKKVFITGHTGFKGGWLSLWLQLLGAKVYGYSLSPPTLPNFYETAGVADLLSGHTLEDILHGERLSKVIKSIQPDIVFHLAAQPLVRYSYKAPVETYAVNVLGTANLLEAVRLTPSIRAVVNITTDKCYENREWCYPYRENDPLGGHDPYSASKACAEIVTKSYRASFFTTSLETNQPLAEIATVRAGNVIGGGDWAEARLIPDCIQSLIQQKPIYLRYPGAIRPWQHGL